MTAPVTPYNNTNCHWLVKKNKLKAAAAVFLNAAVSLNTSFGPSFVIGYQLKAGAPSPLPPIATGGTSIFNLIASTLQSKFLDDKSCPKNMGGFTSDELVQKMKRGITRDEFYSHVVSDRKANHDSWAKLKANILANSDCFSSYNASLKNASTANKDANHGKTLPSRAEVLEVYKQPLMTMRAIEKYFKVRKEYPVVFRSINPSGVAYEALSSAINELSENLTYNIRNSSAAGDITPRVPIKVSDNLKGEPSAPKPTWLDIQNEMIQETNGGLSEKIRAQNAAIAFEKQHLLSVSYSTMHCTPAESWHSFFMDYGISAGSNDGTKLYDEVVENILESVTTGKNAKLRFIVKSDSPGLSSEGETVTKSSNEDLIFNEMKTLFTKYMETCKSSGKKNGVLDYSNGRMIQAGVILAQNLETTREWNLNNFVYLSGPYGVPKIDIDDKSNSDAEWRLRKRYIDDDPKAKKDALHPDTRRLASSNKILDEMMKDYDCNKQDCPKLLNENTQARISSYVTENVNPIYYSRIYTNDEHQQAFEEFAKGIKDVLGKYMEKI